MKTLCLFVMMLWGCVSEKPSLTNASTDSYEVSQGRQWYLVLRCFECHGLKGDGLGPNAKGLVNSHGLAIQPTDFVRGKFKSGDSVEDISQSIENGITETPMAGYSNESFLVSKADMQVRDSGSGKIRTPLAEALESLSKLEIDGLRRFLDELPSREKMTKESLSSKGKTASKRRHQLSQYVKSLSSK